MIRATSIYNTYLLVAFSVDLVIILGVVWTYKRVLVTKFRELELIMNIIYADLFWCLINIIYSIILLYDKNLNTQIIIISIADFFYEISITFATLTAFCALKTMENPTYLSDQRNFVIIRIFGYACPITTSIIQVCLVIENQWVTLIISLFGYGFIGVCLSFFFYMRIQLSFNKLQLSNEVKAEINTLFLFPLIILLFSIAPDVFLSIAGAYSHTESSKYLELIGNILYPLYALVNCWAYGKSIKILAKRVGNSKHESSNQISLLVSESGSTQMQISQELKS